MARLVPMDARRRVVLPGDLVQAAGLVIGEDLLASTDGNGSIVLRSRAAQLRQIRIELDAGFESDGAGRVEPATSLRSDREADDAELTRRVESSSSNPDAVGAALLDRLGL